MMWERRNVGMARMVSTVMLLIVTLVVGILFYRVMVGFFVPLFLAALLVVIFRPVHEWMGRRMGGRPRAAALGTTAAILLVVLIPMGLVVSIAAAQGTSLISRVNYNSLALAIERTREQLGLEIGNIEPFIRLPALVQTLGDIDSLNTRAEVRQAEDRLREFDRVLATLQQDFAPLTSEQARALEHSHLYLLRLSEHMQALVSPEGPGATSSGATGADTGNASSTEDGLAEDGLAAGDGLVEDELVAGDGLAAGAEAGSVAGLDGGAEAESSDGVDASVEDPVEYGSSVERYQRTLVQLDAATRELVASLLGGSFRAQLKMWANPTDEEIGLMIGRVQTYLQPRILWFTGATGEFLLQVAIGLAIMIISLYFFLADGPAMVRTLMRLSPLDDSYEEALLLEFDRTSRAVVLATVLSALAQGVLATGGYWLAGLGSIVLLFLLTSFMALIPFLGAAAVWIPAALWLGVVEQRWGAAIALAVYGGVVVSSVDNVIKVFVLHGRSSLHPLLALLSVLGGVQVFGPIGILVGPMVVVFLQTTLEILNQELKRYSQASEDSDAAVAGVGGAASTATLAVEANPTAPPTQAKRKNPRRRG